MAALALLPFLLLVGSLFPGQQRGAPSTRQPFAPAPLNPVGLGREDSQLVAMVA